MFIFQSILNRKSIFQIFAYTDFNTGFVCNIFISVTSFIVNWTQYEYCRILLPDEALDLLTIYKQPTYSPIILPFFPAYDEYKISYQ